MKFNFRFAMILFLLVGFLWILVGCGKKSEKIELADKESDKILMNEEAAFSKKSIKEEVTLEKTKVKSKRDITTHFVAPVKMAAKRLIEYNITLAYESNEFLDSRNKLLGIIGKYGFIRSSSTSTKGNFPYLSSTFHVKSEKIYEVLQECDSLGILLKEDISTIDHTGNMFYNRIKLEREQIRIKRKSKAMSNVKQGLKSWREVQESLEVSENTMDEKTFEKWKINDRVAWAKINLSIKGPELPQKAEKIKIPSYKNAFIGIANIMLNIIYALIWLLPFVIIITIIVYFRSSISKFFNKKK